MSNLVAIHILNIRRNLHVFRGVVVIFLSFFVCFFSGAIASESDIGNCNLVRTNKEYPNLNKQWESKFGKIMPIEAMEVAQDHLRSFCCAKGVIKDVDSCKNVNKIYLKSPFLFDHILDIYLRRLDAFGKTKDTKDLIYQLEPDQQGKHWRDFVVEIMLDPKGTPPMEIYNEYKKNWKLSTENTQNLPKWKGNREYKHEYFDEQSLSLNKINKSFSNWNLINKYSNTCEIVAMLYFDAKGNISLRYDGEEYSVFNRGYLGCQRLVKDRIIQENMYIKMILAYQSNTLMKNYLHNFLTKTLVQQEMTKLNEVTSQIIRLMDDVNGSVVKLVPVCS